MTLTTRPIKLSIIEEQELFRELYGSLLGPRNDIECKVIPWSNSQSRSTISSLLGEDRPDALLLGIKKVDRYIIEELHTIRVKDPDIAIVVLLVSYSSKDIELLKRIPMIGSGGTAVFLKQSLDTVQQIQNILVGVSQGQVILDPKVSSLILNEKPEYPFMKQLTSREVEVLGLLSNGYTNASIAKMLYIDLKTVEHHINSMYSKIRGLTDFNEKHPRVSAARLYLQAIGDLADRPQGTSAS